MYIQNTVVLNKKKLKVAFGIQYYNWRAPCITVLTRYSNFLYEDRVFGK